MSSSSATSCLPTSYRASQVKMDIPKTHLMYCNLQLSMSDWLALYKGNKIISVSGPFQPYVPFVWG